MHLKIRQAELIKNALINDKTSSNEELTKYFVDIVGIPEKMAREYLCTRNAYQTHPAFKQSIKT